MIKEGREASKRAAARCLGVDAKRVPELVKTSCLVPQKRQRMDRAEIYLAPLLNLPPRGAYSDAKQVVQQLNLLNARGANMVIYGTCPVGFDFISSSLKQRSGFRKLYWREASWVSGAAIISKF